MTETGIPGLDGLVERFDHVSIAVKEFGDPNPIVDFTGATYVDGGYESATDFHWIQYDLPFWGRLEMIRTDSDDPEHFINRFIQTRGEGLHHLTFKVTDLAAAAAEAARHGFVLTGYNDSTAAWKEVFIHPKSSQGVLIQLAEFPDKG